MCHKPCHYQCATRSGYERVLAQAFWVLHCLSQVSEYMRTIATLPLVTASLILGRVGASRCDIGAIEFPGKHDRPHDEKDDHHDKDNRPHDEEDDHHDRDHAAAAQ
jgi:hypothetical protein